MADIGKSPPQANESLPIAALAEKGLAQYLTDVDLAVLVVNWLHDELNVPRAAGRLLVKSLATLVAAGAERGGGWLGRVAWERSRGLLKRLPYYSTLCEASDRLVQFLDTSLKAKGEAKAIIAGWRPSHSPEFASELTLDLQAHLRQIELIDELTAKVRSGLAEIVEALNPQPGLVLRLFEDVDAGFRRFFYGTQKVPFLGREKELAALSAFLYTPKRFAWWLVAGAGGLGKSRLALELCLCQGMVWRAGFLPDDYKPEDFRNWRPSQPTLLVADYVTARAEILGQIARRLYDRRDELDFPVRLLLLERDSDGQWLSQFRGKGGDALAIDDARHAREHVPLEGLGESDLWHTIELLLGDAGAAPPNRQEAMTALASIDPSGRPLFAAFFADSIAANPGATGWSRKDLLDDVLDREAEKRWKPAGITTVEKDLLAIATMGGGIDLSDDELPEAIRQRLRGGDFSPERYQLLSGQAAQERLAPLEPDILGEVFVLNHLSPAFHGDTERGERARQVAWHLRHGFGMFSFLSRAAADFPNEEPLILLSRPATEEPLTRYVWTMAGVNLVAHLGAAGQIEPARELYDAIAGLAQSHPDEPALREQQANAATNLVAHLGTAGQIEPARELYDAIAGLAQSHPDEPALREQQANAAFNLIY